MSSPKKYKSQHFVPKSYLEAWCDPASLNQPKTSPYVWVFDHDSRQGKRKAPKNLFEETDFYTTKSADGSRDTWIEHALSGLEGDFISVRHGFLQPRKNITVEAKLKLSAFTAAMFPRTRSFRDFQTEQWQGILKTMQEMEEWAKTATPKELLAASAIPSPSGSKGAISKQDIEELANNPTTAFLPSSVLSQTPILASFDLAIFCTDDKIGFITSDAPCVWADPEAHKRPPMYRQPGLVYPSIQIILPASPNRALVFNRKGWNGYYETSELILNRINYGTRLESYKSFVVTENVTRDAWFVEPPRDNHAASSN